MEHQPNNPTNQEIKPKKTLFLRCLFLELRVSLH
jgi:hypothetical protein